MSTIRVQSATRIRQILYKLGLGLVDLELLMWYSCALDPLIYLIMIRVSSDDAAWPGTMDYPFHMQAMAMQWVQFHAVDASTACGVCDGWHDRGHRALVLEWRQVGRTGGQVPAAKYVHMDEYMCVFCTIQFKAYICAHREREMESTPLIATLPF